ncbi:MAG: uracil-DNA glycosylase [Thermoleophilia bacterium]|nr:uracil-DNA glycosylase [Thermoleophilia bacterium]
MGDIQDAYLLRAIRELRDLEREMDGCEACRRAGLLPVKPSGSPTAEVMLVKWTAGLAERQEGVAFFGRPGDAVKKSVTRLGMDPSVLYGTLCVKCIHEGPAGGDAPNPAWLAREIRIVGPAIVVVMGGRTLAALNALGLPLTEPLADEPGVVQRWTPATDAIVVPDIDESLDEQQAKRRFWAAFRALGEWHQAQPPY